MWTRFTKRARRVVFLASDEAMRRDTNEVATEHLLLGLIRDDGIASVVLERSGVLPGHVRQEVEALIGTGDTKAIDREMALSAESKKVIDSAYREARLLDSNYIGQEHLLLGMLSESDSIASRTLNGLGVNYEQAFKVVQSLSKGEANEDSSDTNGNFDKRTLQVLLLAENERRRLNHKLLTPAHLLFALIQNDKEAVRRALEAAEKQGTES